MALVVLSGPEAFEKCVIPYLKSKLLECPDYVTVDPLDASMKHTFAEITKVCVFIRVSAVLFGLRAV